MSGKKVNAINDLRAIATRLEFMYVAEGGSTKRLREIAKELEDEGGE